MSSERREGFFDDVRQEAVELIYAYWSIYHQPIGTRRAADLTIQRIVKKNTAHEWHWPKIPFQITVVRRIEESAKKERYPDRDPPLRSIGLRDYQGQTESQYLPFEAEVVFDGDFGDGGLQG